jgi:hypothetical protein
MMLELRLGIVGMETKSLVVFIVLVLEIRSGFGVGTSASELLYTTISSSQQWLL